MTTLADAVVGVLREWDIGYVFGVSGANIEHLHDAIHREGESELSSVMARSEVGAAFMADARARVHQTLGVCCATSGGGMMNLAVGLAESYADSVPVLAFVGQPARAQHGRGAFQDGSGIGRTVDAHAMFGALTKHVATVESADQFWDQLAEAARTAMSGRPGPAVLLVPRDVWEFEVGDRPADFPCSIDELRGPRHQADPVQLMSLVEAMAEATAPVIVAGPGTRGATDELVRFAELTGASVVTTMADLAAFPHGHAQYRGMIGAAGHPSAHALLADRADLVIGVGTTLDVMTRAAVAPALERARVAVVDVDADLAMRSVGVEIAVAGDVRSSLTELCAAARDLPRRRPIDVAPTRYAAIPVSVPASRGRRPRTLSTSQAVAALQDNLPARTHVLFDAGNCSATALHRLELSDAATTTIALGQGGMGYALAGAVGVALGSSPHEKTVVLCGDGAFLMLGTEIHTAVDLGLPILYVVFNDNQHGMCVTRQGLFFEGREECVRYADLDVAATVRGFGAPEALWVRQAGTAEEVSDALAEFFADAAQRPGVLELRITAIEMPPFAPFLSPDAAVVPARDVTNEATEAA